MADRCASLTHDSCRVRLGAGRPDRPSGRSWSRHPRLSRTQRPAQGHRTGSSLAAWMATGRSIGRPPSRVLRRASELAGAEPDEALPLGAIDEEVLIAAAVEAGIPASAVRRAIAIERLGPCRRHTSATRCVGPTAVIDEQELPGAPTTCSAASIAGSSWATTCGGTGCATAEASGASGRGRQRSAAHRAPRHRRGSARRPRAHRRHGPRHRRRDVCRAHLGRPPPRPHDAASPPASPSVAWRRPAWSASPWSPSRSSCSPRLSRSPPAAGWLPPRRRAGRVRARARPGHRRRRSAGPAGTAQHRPRPSRQGGAPPGVSRRSTSACSSPLLLIAVSWRASPRRRGR